MRTPKPAGTAVAVAEGREVAGRVLAEQRDIRRMAALQHDERAAGAGAAGQLRPAHRRGATAA